MDDILLPLLKDGEAEHVAEHSDSLGLVDRGVEAVEYSKAELEEDDVANDTKPSDLNKSHWNDDGSAAAADPPLGLDGAEYVPTKFDALLVRRLPPHIAPRSLNNLDEKTTPHKALLDIVLSFLVHPHALHGSSSTNPENLRASHAPYSVPRTPGGSMVDVFPPQPVTYGGDRSTLFGLQLETVNLAWRWRSIDDIYQQLSAEHKSALRSFRGLVNFLRLHGSLVEVSADKRFVIRHDRAGRLIPPLIPTQTFFTYEDRIVVKPSTSPQTRGKLIGDDVRNIYENVLQGAQFPTTRNQLMLLDPQNPVLDSVILSYEISQFLPDHPVSMHSIGSRLPPILRAALGVHYQRVLQKSPFLEFFKQGGSTMVVSLAKKNSKGITAATESRGGVKAVLTIEEVLAEARSLIPMSGIALGTLNRELSSGALGAIIKKYGNVQAFVSANPQFFKLESMEMEGKNGELRRSLMVFNTRSSVPS